MRVELGWQARRLHALLVIALPDDAAEHHSAPFWIGNTDNGTVGDILLGLQHSLDFVRVNALAAGANHVINPAV